MYQVKYLIWHRCLLSVVTELELKARRTGHFARPIAQARTRTGKIYTVFLCSADHEQDRQAYKYSVDTQPAESDDHPHTHMVHGTQVEPVKVNLIEIRPQLTK